MASRAKEEEQHEGASTRELLIEACRRNNTDLLAEILSTPPLRDDEAAAAGLLNSTTTVLGNHLYHEAAARGHYEVIDMLLDQPGFECDPVSRAAGTEGDTPLHSAVRWINGEPPAQRPFGDALVEMMLEAGSNPRLRNRAGLTPPQLVDPANEGLREVFRRHEYAALNAGDFVAVDEVKGGKALLDNNGRGRAADEEQQDGEDAEFSGSDEEERAEWERRRKAKRG